MTAHAQQSASKKEGGPRCVTPRKTEFPSCHQATEARAPDRSPLFGLVSRSVPRSTRHGRSTALVLKAPGVWYPQHPCHLGPCEPVGSQAPPTPVGQTCIVTTFMDPFKCAELREGVLPLPVLWDSFMPRMRAEAPGRRGRGRRRGTMDRKREKWRNNDKGQRGSERLNRWRGQTKQKAQEAGEEEREGAKNTEGKREDRGEKEEQNKGGRGHLPRPRPSELVSG